MQKNCSFVRFSIFSKNTLEKWILCMISNLCKKLMRIATHLIFFQWKLKVHTFSQKRAFYLSIQSELVIWEKRAFNFLKNCNFLKNRKNARKTRVLYFGALALPEMENAHFFLPRTNRVCRKSAFQLLKLEIYKLKRCILECIFPYLSHSLKSRERLT